MKTNYPLLLLFILTVFSTSSKAQNKAVIGSWKGEIELPGAKLEMVFNISEDEEGNLTTKLDVPQQGALNLPVEETKLSKDSILLQVPAILSTYHGQFITPDSIAGEWVQGGQKLVLNLKKTGEVKIIKRPQTPQPPFSYVSEYVEYTNPESGFKLAGTLTLPKNANNCPAVLLISGSGAQDRDETIYEHKPFFVIADYFAKHGIAVLRVDDRGVEGSEGSTREATSKDFAGDVLCGIEYLKSRKDISPTRIGLIGHSEGGLIAPMVANKSEDVAFIILMAGPGTAGDSILLEQTELSAKATGLSEQATNAKLFVIKGIINILKTEADQEARTAAFRKAFTGGMYKMMDDDRKKMVDQQIAAYNNNWFYFFVNYNPYPALTKVACPVLAMIGEKDVQVPPKSNLSAIDKALTEGGNKNFKTIELPSLNHLFQNCKTGSPIEYSQLEETISPDVLELMKNWIFEVSE
ncbi:alpha/beta hydrolase [uncultured Draconibacterium sp.]|uniref:alpha/beta hydrolase family protein n=1 Tax=uncultured Draconibacterium sp. TaxID=1573823 RepID=UPI003216D209